MFRRKCQECGEPMYFQAGVHIRQFCCKECSDKFKEKQYNSPETGPVMPHLKAETISDDGYINLVKAIVHRASEDVTHFKPGTRLREEAEQFFASDYFHALTGLDGGAVLRDLRARHKKNNPDMRGRKPSWSPRAVRCIETGVVYDSIRYAAQVVGCDARTIWGVCNGEKRVAAGFHWEYAEV